VSIPLERALNGVPGLFRLRSISLFGLSQLR
jgi:Cu/Ag efflux pump CusA